jgi:hypothetical protein
MMKFPKKKKQLQKPYKQIVIIKKYEPNLWVKISIGSEIKKY